MLLTSRMHPVLGKDTLPLMEAALLDAHAVGVPGGWSGWSLNALYRRLSRFSGLMKITLSFMQIVTTFDINLAVPWPSSLKDFWKMWSVLSNLSILGSLSLDCMTDGFSFYHSFLLTIAIPPAVLLSIAMVTRYYQAKALPGEEAGL